MDGGGKASGAPFIILNRYINIRLLDSLSNFLYLKLAIVYECGMWLVAPLLVLSSIPDLMHLFNIIGFSSNTP